MLEIIFLHWFARNIGDTVQKKGYNAGGYKVLAVFLWFLGEALGAIVCALNGGQGVGVYLAALMGAGVGALIVHSIAVNRRNLYALNE